MLTSTAISGFPHLVYLVTTSGLRILGDIHDSKDDTEKSIHHFEKAIEIAFSLNRSFGFITPWRSFFSKRASSTTHTLASNEQSRTRSTTHTTWVVRWNCKLGFGINDAHCLMRQSHRGFKL